MNTNATAQMVTSGGFGCGPDKRQTTRPARVRALARDEKNAINEAAAHADTETMITALREIAEDKIRQGDAIWMRDTARAALSQRSTPDSHSERKRKAGAYGQ